MPKKSKTKSAPIPPARLIPGTKDPILSTGPPKDEKDFRIKNERAKELIMSTLLPGSEPWKIAESIENASDIWKALEARYAPHRGQAESEMEDVQGGQHQKQKATATLIQEADDVVHVDIDNEETRKQAQARAVKEFYESMPNPDQRLLWALLHGGKPETDAWFNGTSLRT